MANAHLEITPSRLLVKWANGQAELDLPCPVIPSRADASFSKKRQVLTVRMPRL
jgi:hypothetical protein